MSTASLKEDRMKASTFNRLRELIYDRSGITLGTNKESLVKARLSKRMRKLGIDRYEAYLDLVINDKTGLEMQDLLDAISTNVTSFYREPEHFEFMKTVIKERTKSGVNHLRVWSAACSSGEEPYTLAIEIMEAIGGKPSDVKILATDIAPSVLKTGLKGEYSQEKIASVPRHLQAKYFTKKEAQGKCVHTISDRARDLVLFRQFNLNTFPYPIRGPLDFIFCRNVMIYFDRPIRARIVNEFSRLLRPGGYLFLGHAESLAGISEGYKSIKPSIHMKE